MTIKKYCRYTLLFIATFIFSLSVNAQERLLEKYPQYKLNFSGQLTNGFDVEGYYFIYEVEKVSYFKRKNILEIRDLNLELITDREIILKSTDDVAFMKFDNRFLKMKVCSKDVKECRYYTYNLEGEEIKTEEEEFKGLWSHYFHQYILKPSTFSAVQGKGFLKYSRNRKGKKLGVKIEFLNPEDESKWEYSYPFSENTKMVNLNHFYANDQIIIATVSEFKTKRSGQLPSFFFLGLNPDTGEKLFQTEIELEYRKYRILTTDVSEEHREIYYSGMMYDQTNKTLGGRRVNSFFSFVIGFDGELKEKNFFEFEKSTGPYFKFDKKGKQKDDRYLIYEEIIRLPNGEYLVVAESYEPYGIRNKMHIHDYIIFRFDKNFEKVLSKEVFSRPERNYYHIAGDDFTPAPELGIRTLESGRGFSYLYCQKSDEDDSLSFICLEEREVRKKKNNYKLVLIKYAKGKFSENEIDLGDLEKNHFFLLPAKGSNVAIIQYFPEKNALDFRIERL